MAYRIRYKAYDVSYATNKKTAWTEDKKQYRTIQDAKERASDLEDRGYTVQILEA